MRRTARTSFSVAGGAAQALTVPSLTARMRRMRVTLFATFVNAGTGASSGVSCHGEGVQFFEGATTARDGTFAGSCDGDWIAPPALYDRNGQSPLQLGFLAPTMPATFAAAFDRFAGTAVVEFDCED